MFYTLDYKNFVIIFMVEEDLDCHQPDEGMPNDYEDEDPRVFHKKGNNIVYIITFLIFSS
jgi:hypothetical protein